MSDNRTTETVTDRLRALLDERGVEWKDHHYDNHTWWSDDNNTGWHAENRPAVTGSYVKIEAVLTPEQAIAATLGSEREKQLELLVSHLWYLVNHRSGYGYAAALEAIEELGIEVES